MANTTYVLPADLAAIELLATTSYGRGLLPLASATALRTYAELIIGTNVQAFSGNLAALSGLTAAADKLPYFTGAGTAAVTTISPYARSLLGDASQAAMQTRLGITGGGGGTSLAKEFYPADYGADTTGTISAPVAAQNLTAWNDAIAACEAAGGGSIVVTGTQYLNNQIFLDTSSTDVSYQIVGFGNGSILLLGVGLDDKSLFVHNTSSETVPVSTAGGTAGPQQPNVIIERLQCKIAASAGSYTVGPRLAMTYLGSGFVIQNCRLTGLQTGLYTDGYTDAAIARNLKVVFSMTGAGNGYILEQHGPGDGWLVENCSAAAGAATGSAGAYVGGGGGLAWFNTGKGGQIRNCVGGSTRFTKVTEGYVGGCSCDDNGTLPNEPAIKIQDSEVLIERMRRVACDNTGDTQAMIEIDDDESTAGKGSKVTVRQSGGRWVPNVVADGVVHARSQDLHILGVHPETTIEWQGDDSRVGTTSKFAIAPPRFTAATGAGTGQAARTAINTMFRDEAWKTAGPWRLQNTAGTFEITSPFGLWRCQTFANPSIPAPVVDTAYWGTFTGQTVRYRVQFHFAGMSSTVVESATLVSTANRLVRIDVTQEMPRCELRIWRSVDSGTNYPSFVAVPWRGGPASLYDDGTRIQGITWRTTGYLLPVPAVGGTNCTYAGSVNPNGNKTVWATAAPTAGSWTSGDLAINTGAGAGLGWRCSVSGTTGGTWVTV